MKRFLACLSFVVLPVGAFAAKGGLPFPATPHQDHASLVLPTFEVTPPGSEAFLKERKAWSGSKRKIASQQSFGEGDMSADMKKFRDEWLKVKTADEFEGLLKTALANEEKYSPDLKFVVASARVVLPLRGLVWRLRPLFEESKGFMGNRATHVSAVQFVRTAATGLRDFVPTEQSQALFAFMTEPRTDMGHDNQFRSIYDFQKFLAGDFVGALNEAAKRQKAILQANPGAVFVIDNKMAYGPATFTDGLNRYSGFGAAEMNLSLAALYETMHDALVFCAYNQDALITVAGDLGRNMGMDSVGLGRGEFGLTDQERHAIVGKAIARHQFLELRDYKGSTYGTLAMKSAYGALVNAVAHTEQAYQLLQGQPPSLVMGLNPVRFQPAQLPRAEMGIKNMTALVRGPAEIRNPLTGETVTLNVPAYYSNPPKNLKVLMATRFDTAGGSEKTIRNTKGESLKVRNYLYGRSIGWDNEAWAPYVPSAKGQPADYMMNVRRNMVYTLGTPMAFGVPALFVN